MFKNAVELSHFYLKNQLKKGDFAVDATCGNGYDTLFLDNLVGENGKILAFDVQEIAIQESTKRLKDFGICKNVSFVLDGHENMSKYLNQQKVDAFIFNLGYLPKGDHSIQTRAETTILALKNALFHLNENGMILLCIYHGKDSGTQERDELLDYLKTLDSHLYNVIIHEYTNKPNHPPILAVICHNKKG